MGCALCEGGGVCHGSTDRCTSAVWSDSYVHSMAEAAATAMLPTFSVWHRQKDVVFSVFCPECAVEDSIEAARARQIAAAGCCPGTVAARRIASSWTSDMKGFSQLTGHDGKSAKEPLAHSVLPCSTRRSKPACRSCPYSRMNGHPRTSDQPTSSSRHCVATLTALTRSRHPGPWSRRRSPTPSYRAPDSTALRASR